MSDNEIKKALECCSEPAGKCCCEVCPLHHREDSCTTALIKMAVELVNRKDAEIEKLENIERFADKVIKKQEAEIKNLTISCSNFENALKSLKRIEKKAINEIKSEAIKEFAEKLKECRVIQTANMSGYIDNLVKEMTEVNENG